MNYWKNKIVLITGGSSGLGKVITETFAKEGAKTIIVGLEEHLVINTEKEFTDKGYSCKGISANITKDEEVTKILQYVQQEYNNLHILVNCAGKSDRGALLNTPPDKFLSLYELNFLGMVRCIRAFAPYIIKNKGHIINIGSLAAKTAGKWMGAYPVSKFAVAAYSQQLRLELKKNKVHVLLVCPGPIKRNYPRLYEFDNTDNIPESAKKPGGGVKTKTIDPYWLAQKILQYTKLRKPELIIPKKAKILFAIQQISPTIADWIIEKNT